MPNPADQLRAIRTFDDLVRYLEDELDWPLQEYGFDELTFEYSPAELGLKDEDAAKVKTVRQLRPVVHGQPFGIFFVEFERKRMPVVVLRRILSHLVLKQRASANQAGAAAWNLDDLLFISAFGDGRAGGAHGDQREIAFAHFWADPESPGDLPVLKVLGWDGGDTILHIAEAEKVLRERLRWPDDATDLRAWRSQWASAFTLRHREVIQTATQLVEELARLATAVRRRMNAILASESEQGPIRRLHSDFRKTLIHDLSDDDFADVVAQTITYGLLAARFSRPAGISVHDLPRMVPPTNPFLRDLLEMFLEATGHTETLNFDELGIQDVVEVLNRANADAVKVDFGNRTRSEDPVVHFYEHFLKAYDARRKVQRGVFYTPQPVVSYIVRSVHELLQTEFGLEDGLASTVTWGEMAARHKELAIPNGVSPSASFVVVLDPATGTGTFLVEVIEVIFNTLIEKWTRQRLSPAQRAAAWNAYVPEHLFPRLFGYELMMAPYAIAHMKLGLKLSEINTRLGQPDYQFRFAGRAHIYLTNALEPATELQDQFAFVVPALAHEAQAVNAIKRGQRFTVVVGNPPYSNFGQLNRIPWILGLLDDYKLGLDEKKLNLDDDYLKFFRLGQHTIGSTGVGILGLITNSSFLDGLVHRKMRESLLAQFDDCHIVDLHGNSRRGDKTPDGRPDENVFDIQQGVTISLWAKRGFRAAKSVMHFELFGSRESKHEALATKAPYSFKWHRLEPKEQHFFLIFQDTTLQSEYESSVPLSDVFSVIGSGLNTDRDDLCIDFDKSQLEIRMQRVFSGEIDEEFCETYNLQPSSSYDPLALAKKQDFDPKALQVCIYRPFDWRHIYYKVGFTSRPVFEVQGHMLNPNIALLVCRQTKEPFAVLTTRHISTHKIVAVYDRTFLAPLWLYPTGHHAQRTLSGDMPSNPSFSRAFGRRLATCLKVSQGEYGLPHDLTPEDIFHYIYAVFHSPTYRARYAEFLKIDFPRVPLTGSLDLFRGLAALGGELVALHLMESPALAQHITTYAGPAAPAVEKVAYADGAVWIDKAQTAGFRGVPEAVWNFHIGGYQVCDKWLKDRKGRVLSAEDIEHYQRVVVALHETIRIMGEIDAVIEEHGGWPIQ